MARITQITRRPATTPANQLWLRQAARHGYRLSAQAPEDALRIGEEIDEFMAMLRRGLAWGTECSGLPRCRSPFDLAARVRISLGLDKLARLARRFGDAYRREVDIFAREAELWKGVRWEAIGPVEQRYGDVVVVQLLTPAELQAEGREMRHCVAAYAEPCLRGRSQIWSLRTPEGKPLSTLETLLPQGPNAAGLQVNQHKGVSNTTVPAICNQAVHALMQNLRAEPAHKERYLAWRQTMQRHKLAERQQIALLQPIVAALQKTLPTAWSWEHLMALATTERGEVSNG